VDSKTSNLLEFSNSQISKFFFCTFAHHFYIRNMRIIDTKGLPCPAPLIAAKKALKETSVGESFIVLTDNQTSFNNLGRFLKDNSTDFQVNESGGVWTMTVTVTKNTGEVSPAREEDYCTSTNTHFEKGNYVIVVTSDKMGEGDEELGHLLMGNFIKALKDLDRLPQKMVFYNNGVKLATNNSPVISHLKDLEKMGVELMLCATCVSHYSIESVVGAGTVSNMYAIAEVMASAGNIVRP
jgi:selenium metabolism protein YedF